MPDTQMPKTAYVDGLTGQGITYGQLKKDLEAFSRGIRDPKSAWGGLKKHQIACMFGPNSVVLPTVIFGIMAAGGGLSPSNPNYLPRELAHQLRSSGSSLLISHSSMLPTALEASKEVGFKSHQIILLDEAPGYPTVSQIVKRGYQLSEEDVGGKVVLTEHDIKVRALGSEMLAKKSF